jgi:hypothetical protein
VISGKAANGVLKVRDGVIKGIGMAVKLSQGGIVRAVE